MLILLLLIAILIFVGVGIFYDWEMGFWITCIPACVIIIVLIFCSVGYTDILTIDDKISLYETQNAEIEQEITAIVESYKDYEAETFKAVAKKVDPLVVYTIYPELKSNALVTDQIKLYRENNDKITQLKSQKINLQGLGWWIHFNIFNSQE